MRLRLVLGLFLFGAGCAAPVFTPVALAQMDSREAIALQNQILDLRRQLQALNDGRGGGGSSLGGSYRPPAPQTQGGGGGGDMVAQLLDRVTTLEDQVRRLQGRIDEADNARQRQIDDLTKQMGDLSFRVQNGGGGGGGGSPPPRPQGPPAGTLGGPPPADDSGSGAPAAPPRRTPELILQEGNAALARRDYAAAGAAAKEALAGPRTPRSTDAQFLLAQSLMGQRDYGQAALAYDDAYKRNPRGGHAQDALIGLANAMVGLGDKAASCQSLDKLRVEFPTARPDVREAAVAARGRAGCR